MIEHIKAIDGAVQAIEEAKLQGNVLSSQHKTELKTLADQLVAIQAEFSCHDSQVHVQVSLLSGDPLFEEEMSAALTVLHVKEKVVSMKPEWSYQLKVVVAEGKAAILDDAQCLRDLASEGRVHLMVVFNAVREQVLAAIFRATGWDHVDPDEAFLDQGLDSLISAQFRNVLQEFFPQVAWEATFLFDYPSIADMCHYIESEMSNPWCWKLLSFGERGPFLNATRPDRPDRLSELGTLTQGLLLVTITNMQ